MILFEVAIFAEKMGIKHNTVIYFTDQRVSVIDESWYQRPTTIRERISAGGVVARRADDNTVLIALVRERDFPDFVLPKGGVEKGESLEQAARREIEEEAGLSDLELICKLGHLQRLNYNKTRWLITHFFLYRTTQIEGIPTDADNHFGVWWYPIDALPRIFWPEQRELIVTNRDLIKSQILVNDE